MQVLRRILVAAAASAALAACAPATEQAGNNFVSHSKTELVVQNRNWQDINVYLVHGGGRTRLGTVTAMARASFPVPDAYVLGVSDINVQADPTGSHRTFTSGPIQVYPGARLELTVENAIQLSSFAVYKAGI